MEIEDKTKTYPLGDLGFTLSILEDLVDPVLEEYPHGALLSNVFRNTNHLVVIKPNLVRIVDKQDTDLSLSLNPKRVPKGAMNYKVLSIFN